MSERASPRFGSHCRQHALRGEACSLERRQALFLAHRAYLREVLLVRALVRGSHSLNPLVNGLGHRSEV